MKKRISIYAIFFLMSCIFSHCGDSTEDVMTEPEALLKPASSVKIKDIRNFNDGRDIELSFVVPSDLSLVEEFRIFIVPEFSTSSFDSLTALTTSQYTVVSKFTSTSLINLVETQIDIEGNLVTEGVSYNAFVLAVATSEGALGGVLSQPSNTLTLEQKNAVWTLTANISGGSGGMDVDADGNIYMSDFGTALGAGGVAGSRVFKITPDGKVDVFATGLIGASGSDFDPDGNLIQSNIGAGTVSKITPDGIVTTIATGFSQPVGVTVDQNGDFFVCNCGANSISKVTNGGASVSNFAVSTLMNCPNGIDMDAQGNLYVASFSSRNLVKITSTGQVSVLATMPGNNNGHLLINGDFIYVISRGLHQIHRVPLNGGSVSLFAGTGSRGVVNGPLLEAGFSFPNDLAFSPDGKKMYVNDVNAGNNGNILTPVVIRVVDIVE